MLVCSYAFIRSLVIQGRSHQRGAGGAAAPPPRGTLAPPPRQFSKFVKVYNYTVLLLCNSVKTDEMVWKYLFSTKAPARINQQLVETPETIRNWLLSQCRLKSFFWKLKLEKNYFLPSVGFEPTTSGNLDQRLNHSTTRACDRIQIQSRLLYND